MVGVLFIITVPQKEHENSMLKEKSAKMFIEKEKYEKASKVIHELRKNRRFGSAKSSIESYATDDDSSLNVSKCKSIDCLSTDGEGLYKSRSENSLNDALHKSGIKSSWEEIKQSLKPKRNKLEITRPVRGIDILEAFQWDTPLETILSEILTRLNINSAAWNATRDNIFWKVTFSLQSGSLCEELVQVLQTFGIGSRGQSSMSVLPCTLYYHSSRDSEESVGKNNIWRSGTSRWSRFSSSVRARNHLPQILHAVRAEASLTFDWLFLLIVAAFVAAIGLVEDSTVILVASMLISPLMGPITAGTLGTAVQDRSLQSMGLIHEMLGLFLALIIGFIFGLTICAVDERYGNGDWPTFEMMSRCEMRSLWVGLLVAIPSGAAVALAVLSEYTASLVGVAISASLLPPAVNAGLLWSMSLVHLIYADDETRWNGVITSSKYNKDPATELALLGTVSLCLTLVNIFCIFIAGVAVYKVKEVCPLDKKDIPWWRTRGDLQSAKDDKQSANALDIYSKWCNDPMGESKMKHPEIQSDTVTYRKQNHSGFQRIRAQSIPDYCLQNAPNYKSYTSRDHSLETVLDPEEKTSKTSDISQKTILSRNNSDKDSTKTNLSDLNSYYNISFEGTEDNSQHTEVCKDSDHSYYPTIEPSSNLAIDAKNNGIVLGTKSFHV